MSGKDLSLFDIESGTDQISNSGLIEIVFLTYFHYAIELYNLQSSKKGRFFMNFHRIPERQNSSIFRVEISISLSVWLSTTFEILYRSIDLESCFEIGSAFQTSIAFEITSNENSFSSINRANPKNPFDQIENLMVALRGNLNLFEAFVARHQDIQEIQK